MGSGTFEQPPEGPKIGPTKELADLPEAKRQELGDLDKLVSEPAKLDPRVATEPLAAKIEDLPPSAEPDKSQEGLARMEALQAVLEEEPEPVVDPAEAVIEEAAEPTIEERQEFMRCVLGNKPYERAFELFGGTIKLKMLDVSPADMDTLFSQLAHDQQSGVIETVDDWNTELDRYRMFWMTSELVWGEETLHPYKAAVECGNGKGRAALNRFLLRFQSSVPYRAMLHATRIFQRHLDKLTEGALDPDFWEAGGSDSPSEPTSEEPSITESSPD